MHPFLRPDRLLFGACLVLAGCSAAPVLPAQPPPQEPQTRLYAPIRRHITDPPEIQAPPPAYGNKIVMAERAPHSQL
ncbi:MAG TPA: hypothetical protein VFQ61_31515 [Polyangiaceae bacterium]|nr:hypothetical protein [Polyangiaceae bacterium]